MKRNLYLITLIAIVGLNAPLVATAYLVLQNDTEKQIDFDRNNLGITYQLGAGQRKPTSADHLESIYAKYRMDDKYNKLDLGRSIKDAQQEGIDSIIHIVPGIFYGVRVGKIEKRYDNMSIPVSAKMEVLRPLGLNMTEIDVPKFSKAIAAKILGIAITSTAKQAEEAYLVKAQNRDRNVSEDVNNYRAYLLNKALRTFGG